MAHMFVLFILCFLLTKEHLHTVSKVSVGSDLKMLVHNKPWWLMIGAALCSNLFNTVRGSTVAFFFADVLGTKYALSIPALGISFLLFAGLFLTIGEISNMVGVALAVPITNKLGKKSTFIMVNICLIVLSVMFFFIPVTNGGVWAMLVLQVIISIFTGIQSPLVWSMYADVSDYAELKYKTASTGLIFSSASMAQKFGGAVGGAAVTWLLAACGYVANAEAGFTQPDSAITCLKMLMSFIPALVSVLAVVVTYFYPLTTKRIAEINEQRVVMRGTSTTRVRQHLYYPMVSCMRNSSLVWDVWQTSLHPSKLLTAHLFPCCSVLGTSTRAAGSGGDRRYAPPSSTRPCGV